MRSLISKKVLAQHAQTYQGALISKWSSNLHAHPFLTSACAGCGQCITVRSIEFMHGITLQEALRWTI